MSSFYWRFLVPLRVEFHPRSYSWRRSDACFSSVLDQIPNSRQIVEDWKTGWSVKRAEAGSEILVAKEVISELVQRFMDLESCEGNKIRKRAREMKNLCRQAIAKSGSSYANLDAFICNFLDGHGH
jgi:hypothetical protein